MELLKAKLKELSPLFFLLALSFSAYLVEQTCSFGLGKSPELFSGISFMALLFGFIAYNKFTDTAEDFTNDITGVLYFQRNRVLLFLALSSFVFFIGYHLASNSLTWAGVLLMASGLPYSLRLIPLYLPSTGIRMTRFKDIPVFKNLLFASWWVIGACLAPIGDGMWAMIFSDKGLTILSALFSIAFTSSVLDDISDENGDRVAGIRTIPTIFGARKAFFFLVIANAISIVAATLVLLTHALPMEAWSFLSLNFSLNIAVILIQFFDPTRRSWKILYFPLQLILFNVFTILLVTFS